MFSDAVFCDLVKKIYIRFVGVVGFSFRVPWSIDLHRFWGIIGFCFGAACSRTFSETGHGDLVKRFT